MNSDYSALAKLRLNTCWVDDDTNEKRETKEDNADDDSDEEFLRELDALPMTIEEQDRLRKVQEIQEASNALGLGTHREDTLQHLQLLQSSKQPQLSEDQSPPLLLHVYFDCTSSALVDLALERIASRYHGLRCRRIHISELTLLLLSTTAPAANQTLLCELYAHRIELLSKSERYSLLLCFQSSRLKQLVDTAEVVGDDVEMTQRLLTRFLEQAHMALCEPPALSWIDALDNNRKDEEDDDIKEEFFDCGVKGCRKPFAHEHVSTSQASFAVLQSGAEALASNVFQRL